MTNLVINDIRPTLADALLSPEALARRWSVKPTTLATMRSQGRGPRYYKLPNGIVRYPEWAVFDWEIGKAAA
jgi:hypothetical protein